MRLLFVHEVNWWSKVIYEIHELPELLSIEGHEVTIIDFPEGIEPRGFRRFLDFRSSIVPSARRAYAGSSVEVRTPGRVMRSPLDRLLATFTFLPLLRKTLEEKRPDVIVLYGVPTNGWQTIRMAQEFNIPVLFRALDVSHKLRKTIFKPLIYLVEKYIYRKAQLVSANNAALAAYCTRSGALHGDVRVNYPGLDLDTFKPAARNMALALSLGISPNNRVIMFMGTLYRFSGLDTFLRLVGPTLRCNSHVKILLIGGGEFEKPLREEVHKLGVADQVIFTGFVDYGVLAEYMLLADVAINTFPPSLVTDCALPSKVLQYLCCGIPTVATPVDGLRTIIPEGGGVLYRPLDETFVPAVMSLIANDSVRHQLSVISRQSAENLCSWDRNLKSFIDVINEAISRLPSK